MLSVVALTSQAQKAIQSNKTEGFTRYSAKDGQTSAFTTSTDLIAVKSPKLDTLYLIDNIMGKNIEHIWITDKKITEKKPILIYLSNTALKAKHQNYTIRTAQKTKG